MRVERISRRTKAEPGEVYGSWTLINFSRMEKNGQVWLVSCSCGIKVERNLSQIKAGKTTKCRDCRNLELSEMSISARGDKSPNWKGGRSITNRGYALLSGYHGHPNANKKGLIQEHTLVMSECIGRSLFPNEEVHHKNGIRDDNRIENLELWTTNQPKGQRVEDKISWSIEFLQSYGYSISG